MPRVTFDIGSFVRLGLVPTGHRFGVLIDRVMKMTPPDSSHRLWRCDEFGGAVGRRDLELQSCGRRGKPQPT